MKPAVMAKRYVLRWAPPTDGHAGLIERRLVERGAGGGTGAVLSVVKCDGAEAALRGPPGASVSWAITRQK